MKFKRYLLAVSFLLALVFSLALAACGGNGKVTLRFETGGGTAVEAIEAEPGENIREKLPADPTRVGYTFGGWYLEPDCSGERRTLPSTMPDESATYYAKWMEQAPAKLTLLSGDGGTLQKTELDVPVGTPLSDVLKDLTPTAIKAGLTFAGWYQNNAPIAEGAIMPVNALTLTAKYYANYTVTLHTEEADGSYTSAEPQTGTAFYGEPFDATVSVQAPAHFRLDGNADGARGSTDALAANDAFHIYLSREVYHVFYEAAAPEGETSSGSVPMAEVRYGNSFTVAENGYTMSGIYRFMGWATERGGAVEYAPGETVTPEADLFLFASWKQGLSDLFGGGDRLFVSEEENAVYLLREDLPEKKGELDPATGIFTFQQDGSTVLDGRVTDNWFFYFLDAYEATYADLDGTAATLTLSPHGEAVYNDGSKSYTGTYAIDLDTLHYAFCAEELTFLFEFFEPVDGGDLVFRRQNLEEEGYYYDAEAGIVLYLDGLGGLEYHYNTENYEYTVFGSPVLTANGYYEWSEGAGLFIAYTRDYATILKQFSFSLDTRTQPTPQEQYEDIGDIKGTADMDDGLRGEYSDKWNSNGQTLMLDGYGAGTYGEAEGTYSLITWLYVYEEEDDDVVDDYLLVRFVPEKGGVIYFRLDMENGDFELDRTIPEEEFNGEIPHGRIDFTGEVHTLNDFFSGFLYIFENGDAEFWSEYAETTLGDICYVLYTELISTVVKNQDGSYRFEQSVNESTSIYYENAFDFEMDANGKAHAVYPEPHDVATVADGLTLDFTEGVATYNGKRVDYGFTLGYIDLYIFIVDETTRAQRYFITSDNEHFTEVFLSDMYDIDYAGGEENEYTGRLLFAGDKVYLALLLESGLYRYIGEGTVTTTDGVEHFTLGKFLDDFVPSDLAEYAEFGFKRTAGQDGQAGTFIQQQTGDRYTNFTGDGFGSYTFTEDGKSVTGKIVSSVGDLLFFEAENGDEYILTAEGDTMYNVTGPDAGFWYEMNDNLLISQYEYFVLNGRGGAVLYDYDILEGEMHVTAATYRRTDNWTETFKEYDITETASRQTYRVLFGVYEITDGTTSQRMPLYQVQIEHRIGDFDVIGGGHVQSKGYPNLSATYVDAQGQHYEGNMYLGYVNTGTADHGFVNSSARATAVRFWVYDANNLPTSTEFIFDIVNGELSLRTLAYGDYALSDREHVDTTTVLTLDGHGKATAKRGYTSLGSGTYSALPEIDAYLFDGTLNGEHTAFTFRTRRIAGADEDDLDTYVYELYEEEENGVYVSDADWSILRLDGFGGATFIDRYGTVMQGNYTVITETLGYFSAAGYETLYTVQAGGKFALVDNSAYVANYYAEDFSAVEFGPARLIVGGTEYFYTVSATTVTRYTAEGASDTVALPAGDSYTLGGKTYRKLTGEVTFQDHDYEGAPLTLTFRPDGAVFTADADFVMGEIAGMGYSVSVSYENGAVKVTLGYRSGEMNSQAETYALTLHFKGTDNTFAVVPAGEEGTFTDSADAKNTMKIDGLRVGQFLVTDSLTVQLGSIQDMEGAVLAFEGKYSAAVADMTHNDFNFGYGKVLALTCGDGQSYTLRFFLDVARSQFILNSVTLEKTFDVEKVGEVTVIQLVKSGRDYAGCKDLEVVGITVPGNEVTEVEYNTTLEDGKRAVLVRSTINTTTGAYTYETFIIDLTYADDGLVSGATCDGNKYRYGEAEQGIVYRIAFLYTLEGGTFEVKYLLDFFDHDKSVEATFTKNGDGSWKIAIGAETYTARITQSGSGFGLNVTKNQ